MPIKYINDDLAHLMADEAPLSNYLEVFGSNGFMDNARAEARKLADIKCDKIIATGQTQIGKQTICLFQSLYEFQNFCEAQVDMGRKRGMFINIDIVCASRKDLKDKKIKDHKTFFNLRTPFQPGYTFVDLVCHHDDIIRATKSPSQNTLDVIIYGTTYDSRGVPQQNISNSKMSLNEFSRCIGKGAFVNIQCDEIHQYKRHGSALHELLRKYLKINLTKQNGTASKLICITATSQDTHAYLAEEDIQPDIFRPVFLKPPANLYYGWGDFIEDNLLDDFKRYELAAKKKYANDPKKRNLYKNYAVLEYIKEIYHEFMTGAATGVLDNLVSRNPYLGKQAKEKQEHLIKIINDFISEKEGEYGPCKLHVVSSKKEHREARSEFESIVGITSETYVSMESQSFFDEPEIAPTKNIFLIINLYDVGVSIDTKKIFAWIEPGDSWDSTYAQRCGRVCGSDKATNGTRLCANLAKLLELQQAYDEYAKSELDTSILAAKTSGCHKTTKTPKGQWLNFLYASELVESIHVPKKGKLQKMSPYKLSTRGANISKENKKLIFSGKLKSPTALVLEVIESIISNGGVTSGNILFPIYLGGEINCFYAGLKRYGLEIDGPCIYATDDEKRRLNKYLGKTLCSNYAGRVKWIADPAKPPTVKNMSQSQSKTNMLSKFKGAFVEAA